MSEATNITKVPKNLQCKSWSGGLVALTLEDLTTIEDMTSCGCKADMIATHLGLCISSFKTLCKESRHVEGAIKRGRARDEWEYRLALRGAALTMKSPILTIWHGKQAYSMSDKVTTHHEGGNVIMVETGVPGPDSSDNSVIDHE